MRREEPGFTLIEVLIVVAVIGLIAAITIPNMLLAIQRAKQKRAMAELRGMGTACNSYATDTNYAPLSNTTFTATDTIASMLELQPYYLNSVPNPDPWGTKYQYASTDTGTDFVVRSLGKDNVVDSPAFTTDIDPTTPPRGTQCLENDVVWVNGNFLLYPDGKQRKCV